MNGFFTQLPEDAPGIDFVPDDAQARVLNSDARRVLLCCSRQFGKSTTAALLAARTALATPKATIVCVSPTLRQSGELIRKVREFLGIQSSGLNLQLPNGSRILAAPARQATVRGYSAVNLLIVDEAAQVGEGWFAQEYLCSFVGMENAVFRCEWLAAAEQRGLGQRRLFQ